MEIQIKPEDIDKYVSDAILQSTIGRDLKKNIDKAFNEVFTGWRNPVQQLVSSSLKEIVKEYLSLPENREKINIAISKYFTQEMIDKLIGSACRIFLEHVKEEDLNSNGT